MELFKLLGTIAVDNQAALKAIRETSGEADEFASTSERTQSRVGQAFSKIGSFAVNCGKVVAAGIAVGATALGGLTVKAVNMAGELEQNMGGSEAVFQEYAGSMQETASEAFENMGLSMSDFLANANKMGALFQGSGFTIQESAKLSAEVMQRAADVASIMGIDVSSAMEAVTGAAKGNYTMLDNLGVAVNETTLEQYALAQGIETAYSEMTTQQKVGLAMQLFMEKTAYAAGNYAKENDTLAGSLNTAKAALDNFLSGAGDADAVVEAAINAVSVIEENVNEILPHLVNGINTLLKKLAPKIAPMVKSLLPSFIDGAVSIVRGIAGELDEIIDVLIDDVLPNLVVGIVEIVDVIAQKLPVIIERLVPAIAEAGLQLVAGLAKSIVGAIPELVESIGMALWGVVDAIKDFVGIEEEAGTATYDFTVQLRENGREIEENIEATQKLRDEYEKNAQVIVNETTLTENLWKELQKITDENGYVTDANKHRAQYILGELNEALGTEYEMNGNIITQYQEMQDEIDTLIEKRQAERLLANYDSLYSDAQTKRTEAQQLYSDTLDAWNAAAEAYEKALANSEAFSRGEEYERLPDDNLLLNPWDEAQRRYEILYGADGNGGIHAQLVAAQQDLTATEETLYTYQKAYEAFYAGHYEAVEKYLTNTTELKWDAVREGQIISDEELAQLENDLQTKINLFTLYHREWLAGSDWATNEFIRIEAESLSEYIKLIESATGEAYDMGTNLAEALAQAMEDNQVKVHVAGKKLMETALSSMKYAAQIESPSKVARGFGRFLSEGLALGLSDGAGIAQKAAADVMTDTLGVFENAHTNGLYDVNAVRMRINGIVSDADMSYGGNNAQEAQDSREAVSELVRVLPDLLADALSSMRFDINNREFARLVRAVT